MKRILIPFILLLASFGILPAQVPQLLNYQGRVAVGTTNFNGTGQFKFALVDAGGTLAAQATAFPVMTGPTNNRTVASVSISFPGIGYSTPPTVTFSNGSATATAVVSGGRVTQINVTNGGSYNIFSIPTVTIGPPTAGTYTNTFWSNNGTGLGLSASASEPTAAVALPVVNGLYSVLLGDTGMTAIPASVWANPDVRLRVWFSDGTPTGFQRLTPDQRLAPHGYFSDGSVSSSAIAAGAVTSTQIAAGAVTGTQIAAGAVTSSQIAAGAVTSTQIAAGAVTSTQLAAGAVNSATLAPNLTVTGEITCTAINVTSDRNAKEQFKPVNTREVLARVARLPISEWQYKEQTDARHIGPMAQDFREAFALGHDDRHITSVDADGVALAAIQGLHEIAQEKERDIARLKAENRTLAERLAAIERALGLRREAPTSGDAY